MWDQVEVPHLASRVRHTSSHKSEYSQAYLNVTLLVYANWRCYVCASTACCASMMLICNFCREKSFPRSIPLLQFVQVQMLRRLDYENVVVQKLILALWSTVPTCVWGVMLSCTIWTLGEMMIQGVFLNRPVEHSGNIPHLSLLTTWGKYTAFDLALESWAIVASVNVADISSTS